MIFIKMLAKAFLALLWLVTAGCSPQLRHRDNGLIPELPVWKATWITSGEAASSRMPLFRKEFPVNSRVKRATAHISGLGYYELYINGTRVGDHVLDPAQTNYEAYALYATYDVTDFLLSGTNRIGVMLGDGWYNQNRAFGIDLSYGKPLFICQIDIDYHNKFRTTGAKMGGGMEQIVSDSSWEWTEGPVVSANVYAGEMYDARLEIQDWSAPGGLQGSWKPVAAAGMHPPALKPQILPPIRKIKELKPKTFYRLGDSAIVYDFGQNFAGWTQIRLREAPGTKIILRMSEEVFPDGTLDFTSTGVDATRFVQTDVYVCKGDEYETWEPRFTYHGFRYVQVSGMTGPADKSTLTGIVVHSDVDTAGTFQCSDATINRLHEMAIWSLTSNLHGFPSDCPHREKCGWLGDAHAIAPMSMCNFDMESFWIKYLLDIRTSAARSGKSLHHQEKNRIFYEAFKKPGVPYMIAPGKRECGAASPDWGTAIVQIPWYLYLYYGNREVIGDFYPNMKTWVDYVDSLAVNSLIYQGLGDWCPPGGIDSTDCPCPLSSTAFHYLDLQIMEQIAHLLGFAGDEDHFREKRVLVKQAFINRFYNPETHSFGSQTANSLSLDFGLVPDGREQDVSNAIARDVTQRCYGFHNTGIFGLPRIFDALARYGNGRTAFGILTGTGTRSFENMWKLYGATTLWEELPVSAVPDGSWSTGKFGSHNHAMQGGFDAWFYRGIAGIAPIPENPGYRTIRFEPLLTDFLQWARATCRSAYGEIISSWSWTGGIFTWDIQIPDRCDGQVIIPVRNYYSLHVNGVQEAQNKTMLHLTQGTYSIQIKK